jgi:hypothetical protein
MNKYLLLTAAALIGAATSGVEKASAGAGPYTIQFDGYCDGMTFHRTNLPPLATGLHLNENCAGGTARVMGTVNKKEFLLFEASNYSSLQYATVIHKPIRNGGEWDLAVCFSGTSCFLANSGTYSLGCCAARNSGVPIKAKVAEIIAQRKLLRDRSR